MKFTCSQVELREKPDFYAVTFWEKDQSLEIAPAFESFEAFLESMGQYVMLQRLKAGDECFVECSKGGFSGDLRKFSLKLGHSNFHLSIQKTTIEVDFSGATINRDELSALLSKVIGDRGVVELI